MNKSMILILFLIVIAVVEIFFIFTPNIFNNTQLQDAIESKIPTIFETPITTYEINDECELIESMYGSQLYKNWNDESLQNHPSMVTIEKYQDYINFNNPSSMPPKLVNALTDLMIDVHSINPQLKEFMIKVGSGESLTDGEIMQLTVDCDLPAITSRIVESVIEPEVPILEESHSFIEPKCGVGTVYSYDVNSCVLK